MTCRAVAGPSAVAPRETLTTCTSSSTSAASGAFSPDSPRSGPGATHTSTTDPGRTVDGTDSPGTVSGTSSSSAGSPVTSADRGSSSPDPTSRPSVASCGSG